ncbi:hypothetical protein Syun_026982 [Stephania yunnanensis]|uniref:Phospholipid/glycerol acyltransferase domain-containing protein n=1 Tax=Stephania yunnanensis TaxID=152371 RepID=A0AAP0HPR8_9MAGN
MCSDEAGAYDEEQRLQGRTRTTRMERRLVQRWTSKGGEGQASLQDGDAVAARHQIATRVTSWMRRRQRCKCSTGTYRGTVGIAKKELYVLANHLRIDRSNPAAAIESIKEVARAIVKRNLSLVLFPEGTRSKTGRLLPFKKGFVHIALQSRLPIVPIVLTGTHLAWRKDSLHVRPAPLTVKYLPPIKTDDWTVENIDHHVKMVYDMYIENLPERQRPVMMEELDSYRKKHS